jgi:ribosomal protein S18 acetylase RimI-like enzyme
MYNTFSFAPLSHETVASTWDLFELLKTEGADVSFCDVQSRTELDSWVNHPAHLTYVATDNSANVLAVVRGKRDLSAEKRHSVFLTAATHPKARGNRLAATLTNYALNEMKKEGVTIARIYVYSDNKASLRAVEKLGFILSGKVWMHHLDVSTNTYVDDLIFHKKLD